MRVYKRVELSEYPPAFGTLTRDWGSVLKRAVVTLPGTGCVRRVALDVYSPFSDDVDRLGTWCTFNVVVVAGKPGDTRVST